MLEMVAYLFLMLSFATYFTLYVWLEGCCVLTVNNTEYLLQQIVCTHVGYESGHLGPKITCKLYCGIAAEKLRFKSM